MCVHMLVCGINMCVVHMYIVCVYPCVMCIGMGGGKICTWLPNIDLFCLLIDLCQLTLVTVSY